MAGMGSPDNPVRLASPWRRLVRVHFPAEEFSHLSLMTRVVRGSLEATGQIACSPNEADLTCNPYWASFTTGFAWEYHSTVHPTKRVLGVHGFRDDQWHSVDLADVAVSGMAELPENVAFEDWEVVFGSGGISPPGCPQNFGVHGPGAVFPPVEGDDTAIPVSGIHPAPQPTFRVGITATAACLSDVFVGDPFCSVIPGAWARMMAQCTGNLIGSEAPRANAQQVGETPLTFNALAILDGKAHRANGIWARSDGFVWVLCERSEEDDPEPEETA